MNKVVGVVGCGAVGSHVAIALATAGVGTLNLIDPENLDAANVHRHVLGTADIGVSKVTGLANVIRARFPHIQVNSFAKPVESILESDAGAVLATDLIVVAVGHETIERRLNTFFHGRTNRIHVWLEPLGIGGHVLSLRASGRGCFGCLYRHDDIQGLVNMASLVEPGQEFQRTVAGCSGTFTPFGPLDAEQAAIHASREAIAILRGRRVDPVLLSWTLSKDLFVATGYRLSRRGQCLAEETLHRDPGFVRTDCPVCGEQQG